MKLLLFISFILISFKIQADDKVLPNGKHVGYSYHWDNVKKVGSCLNKSKKWGLNPKFIGPCGDLRGLDLSDYDLSGKDLSGSFFDGVNFESANFNGTKLIGIRASGTNFSKAKMNGSDLSFSILAGSLFDDAKLNGAKFFNSNLSGAKIKSAELSGTRFQKSNIRGAHIESNLKTAVVSGASYTLGTKFDESLTAAHKKTMTNASFSSVENDENEKDQRSPASTK
jgi:uncharacterized protein YjbI with pentapeptide repeats